MCSFQFPSRNRFRRIVQPHRIVSRSISARQTPKKKERPTLANTFLRCSGNRKIEKFNSSPMKNDGWKLKDNPFRLWVSVFFQFGKGFVPLFRGETLQQKKKIATCKMMALGRRIWGDLQLFRGAENVKSHRYWMSCQDGGRMASLETTLEKGATKLKILSIFLGMRKINCPKTYW